MAIPSISWNENGTFSVPNSPKASIKADADIWATRITAVPTVTPNDFILNITVNVIITPRTPPSK